MIFDEDDLDLEAVEAEIYEQTQAEESLAAEFACCECGFINDAQDGHHPEIRCPESGRCGQCGNAWPCAEHLALVPKSKPKRRVSNKKPEKRASKSRRVSRP
jgi:hypothetical protein